MRTLFPSNRLEEFGCLTEADMVSIAEIGAYDQAFPPHAHIRQEGTSDRSVYLLVEGWTFSSFFLGGGERQIIKVHLPGDMLGSTSMCVDHAVDTVTALTPVVVKKVPLAAIGSLMASSSRIATFMLLSAQKERIALMDRLAWIGRCSAVSRLALFLLDLHDRLSRIGAVEGSAFHLPMTQEQIGDLLGLTAVHVNRMFRDLDKASLIERNKHLIKLLDLERLEQVGALPRRRMSSDIGWFRAT